MPNADATTKYPVPPKTITFENGTSITVDTGMLAVNRLSNYFIERFGINPQTGNLNTIDDPFYADVYKVVRQYATALTFVEVAAVGSFSPCEHEREYVSGGTAVFTIAEAIENLNSDLTAMEQGTLF